MEKVECIKIGQARRGKAPNPFLRLVRTLRKKRWSVVWYVFLLLAGLLLYRAGAAYSLRWRGYYAVGGEALVPIILALCYGVAVMIRKIVRECW